MKNAIVVMTALTVFLFASEIEVGTAGGTAYGYPFGC